MLSRPGIRKWELGKGRMAIETKIVKENYSSLSVKSINNKDNGNSSGQASKIRKRK